jgi:hypothetical protein
MQFVHYRLRTSDVRPPRTRLPQCQLCCAPEPIQRTAWHRRTESFPRRAPRSELALPMFCCPPALAGRPSSRRPAHQPLFGGAAGAASASPAAVRRTQGSAGRHGPGTRARLRNGRHRAPPSSARPTGHGRALSQQPPNHTLELTRYGSQRLAAEEKMPQGLRSGQAPSAYAGSSA